MKDTLIQFASNTGINIKNVGGQDANQGMQAITGIINGVVGILGLVCVVVMIVGGVKYMTSTGDPGKVKAAKDTILYGLIGLIVCALAFAIVNFVIGAMG